MIKSYSVQEPFIFRGVAYEDLQEFRDQLTLVREAGDSDNRILVDKQGNLYLMWAELYPCFDFSDRMCEDRYYRYLFYCKNREEIEQKYQYLNNRYVLGTGAQSDPVLIPNLFYGDDTRFLEIAE